MLREWDDDALVSLLMARPELAFPPPTGFSQVASRATTRHAVAEAVGRLNAFDLWVARRASTHPARFSATELAADLATDSRVTAEDVDASLGRLLGVALLWGDSTLMRPVRALSGLLNASADELPTPPPASPPLFHDVRLVAPSLVANVAAGSAFEFVRRIDVLVEHSDHQPTQLRRAGGPAAREVRSLAALLDLPGTMALVHLELAQAAGLLGVGAQGNDEVLMPTQRFDDWQLCSLAEQWTQVTRAWLDHHPPSGHRWLKDLCLSAFGDPGEGRVLTLEQLQVWLDWQRPRRAPAADRQTAAMLEHAGWIGVTGLGALSDFARTLDAAQLEPMLPARVDSVVLQADLTAVAPGPLTSAVARDLAAMADVESRGGATVYRFSVESLRRAQVTGWSASDIASALERMSTTPVPQPLRYLVFDLERPQGGHGQAVDVPAGSARQDIAPVPERHTVSRRAVRTPNRDLAAGPEDRLDETMARAIVAALQRNAVEHLGATALRMPTPGEQIFDSPTETLREAVETGEVVWFGYVDTAGGSGERLVRATAVEQGRLEATDARTEQSLTVPLHRITTAHIIRTDS
ncbi:MAG: helicase-associated domain-containing protein [Nocardioidaceae bacterium]